MGWDYYTYTRQPQWFLDTIMMKMGVDAERQQVEMKKIKHGNH